MVSAQVAYVGFAAREGTRDYTLRVSPPAGTGDPYDITLAIANEAFVAGRVRYQDAPEICFLKLQRELLASGGQRPPGKLIVTEADLMDYRSAHAPRPPQRRPRPAPVES